MAAVDREAKLLEIIDALSAGCRITNLLHRRHKQSDENRDNGNDNQEFDEGEAAFAGKGCT